METFTGIIVFGVVAMVYILWTIYITLENLLKEVKALRFQLQETFTPDDADKGHDGHPKMTARLVGEILQMLKRREQQ